MSKTQSWRSQFESTGIDPVFEAGQEKSYGNGKRSRCRSVFAGLHSVVRVPVLAGLICASVVTSAANGVTFEPPVHFYFAGSARDVAIGEFNGDQIPDLAVVLFDANGVSVMLGTGNGLFSSGVQYLTGDSPESVAVGDLNGDQVDDVVVANSGFYTHVYNVAVRLGRGDGTFHAASHFDVGVTPGFVTIGDLNGDQVPDLAVVNEDSDNVSILLGFGDGSFATAVHYDVGEFPTSVAIGDLDGDTFPDLAVSNAGVSADSVSILLGTGNGTFSAAVDYAAGRSPRSVAMGDFDGDQVPDLAVANNFEETGVDDVSVLLGNGDGSFAPAVHYSSTPGDRAFAIAIADLDFDQALDLVVANSDDANIAVLAGVGDGTFLPAVTFDTNPSPLAIAIGDLNGDFVPDVALAANGWVSILFNQFPLSGACCVRTACSIVASRVCLDLGGNFGGPTATCDDTTDTDGDGVRDLCDVCPGGDDTFDSDDDGVPDACDVCAGGDDTVDGDADGVPNDCDPCPLDNPDDTDGDGVCDTSDICPGGDDTIDSDNDGVPDGCDVCPGNDDNIDSDGDGIPNACDVCPNGSNTVDSDGDGIFDGCDVCPGGNDNIDSDGDSVPDFCDACPGADDTQDADGDGVPDDCDICAGGDDNIDTDSDGIPNDCDACPNGSNTVDSDGDGVFDGCDVCPGGDDNFDSDEDGVPNDCDICASGDDTIDTDGDGVPNACDRCPGLDDTNDSDGDGVPDACDRCPGFDDSSDGDSDGVPDACDACDNNVPDDCEVGSPILAPAPHDILKNRYISIDPRGEGGLNVGGLPFDIRIRMVSTLVNGVTGGGQSWWAGAPDTNCISIVGPTQPVTPPNWDPCLTLHLTGCPIIPTSAYEIAAVIGGLQSGTPLLAETQAKPVGGKWWADVVGHFDPGIPGWTPAQGFVNADDVVAAIKTFQDPNAFNATHVSVTDVHPAGFPLEPWGTPNRQVDANDLFAIILGFMGNEYPGPQIDLCPDP